jgi:hypothetical protein
MKFIDKDEYIVYLLKSLGPKWSIDFGQALLSVALASMSNQQSPRALASASVDLLQVSCGQKMNTLQILQFNHQKRLISQLTCQIIKCSFFTPILSRVFCTNRAVVTSGADVFGI